MAADDSDIVRFIAKSTGLSTELVNRVIQAGEPWPVSVVIQQYFDTKGTALGEALADPDETLHGLDAVEVDPEALARHQQYVATSAGARVEDVSAISDAMQDFFSRQIQDIRRAKRRAAKRRR